MQNIGRSELRQYQISKRLVNVRKAFSVPRFVSSTPEKTETRISWGVHICIDLGSNIWTFRLFNVSKLNDFVKTHPYNFKCSPNASWTTGFYKQVSVCYMSKILILEYFIAHETECIGSFSWKSMSEVFKCICTWSFWRFFFFISTPAYSKHPLKATNGVFAWVRLAFEPFHTSFFIIQANLWNVKCPNAYLPKIMRQWISTSTFRCVSSRSRLFSSMHPLCGQQNHITLMATERQFS